MKSTRNHLSQEDFNMVLEYIPKLNLRKYKIEDIQMLFKISYWCGLRIGEALKLDASSFDFERNEVFLGKTKTEKQGYATIPPSFKTELAIWLMDKQGPLYPKLKYTNVYFWLVKMGKELNILAWIEKNKETGEMTKTHIFRKSVAKDFFYGIHGKEKAPITFCSQKLRHGGKNPIATTFAYLRLGNDDIKEFESRTLGDKYNG